MRGADAHPTVVASARVLSFPAITSGLLDRAIRATGREHEWEHGRFVVGIGRSPLPLLPLPCGARHRRVRELEELRALLREPGAGCRIRGAALGVRAAAHSAVALAVGFAGYLDPEICIDERVARAGGGPYAEAAVRRVAPVVLVVFGR